MLSKREKQVKNLIEENREEEGNEREKLKPRCHLNPKKLSRLCFLHMPELQKVIFCIIRNKRPQSAFPANSRLVIFALN